ncbi:hypothetical protein N8Z94_06015 [Planktomarina temperata]|nr:hypothetical protein [Planktomarina temperata]
MPEFSKLIGAYTGSSALLLVHIYVFLFNTTYLILVTFLPRLFRWKKTSIKPTNVSKFNNVTIAFVLVLMVLFFTLVSDEISYKMVQESDNLSLVSKFFAMLVKLYPMFLITLLVGRMLNYNSVSKLLIILSICAFIVFCLHMGSRSDIAGFLLGIIFIYAYRQKSLFNLRIFLYGTIFIVLLLIIFSLILHMRGGGNLIGFTLDIRQFIFQDYFAPFHVFIAAVNKGFIDPELVLFSNIGNLFPGTTLVLNEPIPYVTEVVSRLMNTNAIIGRTQGFASHIFVDGWVAFGILGFIFSAASVYALVSFVLVLAQRMDPDLEYIIIGLWGMIVLPIIRSQTSVAFRYLAFYIPVIVLAYLIFVRRRNMEKRKELVLGGKGCRE